MADHGFRDWLPGPSAPLAAALVAGGDVLGAWFGAARADPSSPGWWGVQALAWLGVMLACNEALTRLRAMPTTRYARTSATDAWRRHEAHGVATWGVDPRRAPFRTLEAVLREAEGDATGDARTARVRAALAGQLRARIGDAPGWFAPGPHADVRVAFALLVASRRPMDGMDARGLGRLVRERGPDAALEALPDDEGEGIRTKAASALARMVARHAYWETAVLALVAGDGSVWGRPDLLSVRFLEEVRPDLWAALAGMPPPSCETPFWLDRDKPLPGTDAAYPEGAGILAHLAAERRHGGPLPEPCVEPLLEAHPGFRA